MSDKLKKRTVFAITEKVTADGPRSFWTKIGAAFDNRDGSITVKLDALPISGTHAAPRRG